METPTVQRAYTDEQTAANVARGVELLDDYDPGWFHSVDPAALDILDPWWCVLGQMFRHDALGLQTGYDVGCNALGWDRYVDHDAVCTYGFVLPGAGYGLVADADREALQREWVRVIRERQGVAS